ncbi:hypothetical protein GBA63_21860 (plasmid) [Rubrobacter tropicus]|uniref:YoaR-like putative peptidoglycan binding domain-containing protein n=1 Tax=Rubrobacter tropicus TaxID=2653851 RepID=A0A6G8QFX7_9ACTN|nr:peptidoglycan binding domain-containing protein [Rubrobacter tropicus]QIN85362.1 hypothetical protein GBA63_21860 [Rubrobacter tropicus]
MASRDGKTTVSSETRRRRAAPRGTPARRTSGGRRGSSAGGIAGALAPALIVLCALVAVLVAADHLANAGKVHRGVSAGSLYLGGKTPEEAKSLLEARRPGDTREVRLVGGPRGTTLDLGESAADLDAARTAERAYAVGRTGGFFERLGDRADAAVGAASVEPAVSYDRGAVREAVEGLAAETDRKPHPASVSVRDGEAEVAPSREGYALDVPATARNVGRALEDLRGQAPMAGEILEPEVSTPEAEKAAAEASRAMSRAVALTQGERRWELSRAEIGRTMDFATEGGALRVSLDRETLRENLGDVYAALEEEPREASYRVDGAEVSVVPASEGRQINEEKLFGAIEERLIGAGSRREYEVPVGVARPQLTTAEAEAMRPTQKLGSYRTNYSIVQDSGARVENLAISSSAVSGTLLAPGETFSMNGTVSGLDYNATKVIVDGQETLADGGGLCQVTSTLYNAVNEAGLDVVERSPHYSQLPYIRPGLDATVWFGDEQGRGALDMKFENTSDGYVLLREYVADDGYIYAEVWGVPDDVTVQTWSEPVYRNADSAEWVTYQTFREGGKIVYDGVLHRDTYEALKDKKGKPIPADTVPVAPVDP